MQFSRLFPSTVFGLSIIAVASFFLDPSALSGHATAFTWDSLKSPEAIAISAITAIHIAMWFAWRFPGTMWYMNRYFMISAGAPRPFSLLGAAMSHQFFYWHLITNTAVLFAIGVPCKSCSNRLSQFLVLTLPLSATRDRNDQFLGHISDSRDIRQSFYPLFSRSQEKLHACVTGSQWCYIWCSRGESHYHTEVLNILASKPFANSTRSRHYVIPYTSIEFDVNSWLQVLFVGSLLVFEHRVKTVDHMVHRAGYFIGVMLGWMLRTLKPDDAGSYQAPTEGDGEPL
jgi:hypothetical protein